MARMRKTSERKSSRGAKRRHSRRGNNSGDITDEKQRHAKRRNPSNPELPPNENVNKHPDEVYGDTEIPERRENI